MSKGVKIQEGARGQKVLTLPTKLADAFGIKKGDVVHWRIAGANRLELHISK